MAAEKAAKNDERISGAEGGCFCGGVRYRLTAPPFVTLALRTRPLLPLPGLSGERATAWRTAGSAFATTGRPAKVCDVYYDMKTEWPAASLARREACLGPLT